MEPEQRRRILWQLVVVVNHLRITGAEPVRRDRRVTVAISRDKGTMQMRHQAHLIAEWRQTRVDRNPIGIDFRKVIGVADIERCAALRDHSHPERACLSRETGAVVICP